MGPLRTITLSCQNTMVREARPFSDNLQSNCSFELQTKYPAGGLVLVTATINGFTSVNIRFNVFDLLSMLKWRDVTQFFNKLNYVCVSPNRSREPVLYCTVCTALTRSLAYRTESSEFAALHKLSFHHCAEDNLNVSKSSHVQFQ